MTTVTAAAEELTSAGHPEILVLEPDPAAPLDRFESWLLGSDVRVSVLRPHASDPLPETFDAAGLIVLGGRTTLTDADEYPWLAGARNLLRQAVAAEVPVLGICLGAQLLGQATGGTVTVGEGGTELGTVQVRWTRAAAHDPLFAGAPDPFVAGSFHRDAVAELPPGGILLGSTDLYPHQVFRVGARAWGVQFHPEVGAERYSTWRNLARDSSPDFDERFERGRDELIRRDREIVAACSWLAGRFAGLVRARVKA